MREFVNSRYFYKMIITPEYLKKGDTIGIVAPARSVTKRELVPFIKFIEGAGMKLRLGKHLFGLNKQYSGTVVERLIDIREMFLDVEVKAIFGARGGYGSAQLLTGLDWEVIRDNPKWIVGFSDMTALHSGINKTMESIHGVMPISMMMEEPQDDESFRVMLMTLMGERTKYEIEGHAMNVSGEAKGKLCGGNLSVLSSLAGTMYEPDYEGKILFLEDLDEYLYHVDRMILNFELRDVFRKIRGVVIGDFSDMHDNEKPFGKNACEIIAERAVKYNVPCLFGFPAGHKKFNLPLIFGRVSTLTVGEGDCSLKMY